MLSVGSKVNLGCSNYNRDTEKKSVAYLHILKELPFVGFSPAPEKLLADEPKVLKEIKVLVKFIRMIFTR